MTKTIGVLGLQGAVAEHIIMLRGLGVAAKNVSELPDLKGIDGIVIPGGESTAIRDLLTRAKMLEPLRNLVAAGFPTLGTCAGMVLLSQPESLNGIDAQVERNGFGRQRDSFEEDVDLTDFAEPFHGVFIRAPYLSAVGKEVTILAKLGDKIVAASQKNVFVTSFHPELTGDARVHKYFLANFV